MPKRIRSVEDRFRSHFQIAPNGCWIWQGALQKDGYGLFRMQKATWLAHRAAYTLFVGPIPPELELDHVRTRGCISRACVNPDHLEAVTHAENVRRGVKLPKTHCPAGHPYDEANTRWTKAGTYYCRICHRASGRESDRKRYAKHGNRRGADR